MSKLYVFGIGGTGSRVIKSLTMLLTSGVKCGVDTIVPIIIDPDESAADLTRTVKSMQCYKSIREKLDFTNLSKNNFFRTEICESITNFRLPLNNTRDVKFKDYISIGTMTKANEALANMLFSKENLESDMKVGFKGNPNIGSVVLNQFAESNEFKSFANDFQSGDKIFIISSIFGGTGASGFPLLAKTLRSNDKIPNYALINSAQIGAISVLPYFTVKQDDESAIDSGTFISKTKSALSYYFDNISNNNTVNTLYYIADDIRGKYENSEGGITQHNKAHFIELISALAVIDFSLTGSGEFPTIHKEFGVAKDSSQTIFEDFGNETQLLLQQPLTQFILFGKYFKECSSTTFLSQSWAIDRGFDTSFFSNQFVKNVRDMHDDFISWLTEMSENERGFSPFALEKTKNIFEIVKGKDSKHLMALSSNYALYDSFLNKQKVIRSWGKEQQFMELFYRATEELVHKKINF